MSDYVFTEDGLEDYIWWQGQDRKTLKKINALLKAIGRSPFEGDGKPEPLRRINDADRLVYKYVDGQITIYQCKGHYTDH